MNSTIETLPRFIECIMRFVICGNLADACVVVRLDFSTQTEMPQAKETKISDGFLCCYYV